jgi:hypothetical protein
MDTPIWFCLTAECQEKLRKLKPDLKPPLDSWGKKPQMVLEDIDEIDKLMRQTPTWRSSRWKSGS